ncbi:DUF2188 domain-containing protein [Cupriavidus basilensis]|uniref:DUF2188 domain-containing protein n=1 Tax=Cupriavidus basilensis TaxID=68895 RepID=UPI0039F6AD94
MKGDIHVMPAIGRRWAVDVESTEQSVVFYDTQQDAIAAGREKASRHHVELLIHGLDGRVRERSTYRRNP